MPSTWSSGLRWIGLKRAASATPSQKRSSVPARARGATFRHAMGQRHRVHGAGAGAADALDLDALVLQEAIEHAPGERAVGAAAL